MNKNKLLFKDRIEQINNSFIKNGWVTIYENDNSTDDDSLIYCCLFDSKKSNQYKNDNDWIIEPDREGKPTITSFNRNGKWQSKYQSYSEKGIEPFIFVKYFSFSDGREKYIDISEEFVLYFKLYEKGENKQNRKFYFIDELGDLEEVIKVESNIVKIKLKYLMEYISVRKMNFSICFNFSRLEIIKSDNLEAEKLSQDYQSDKHLFHHGIRSLQLSGEEKLQGWTHGKAFINYDKKKSSCFYFDKKKDFENFIVGYDETGKEIYENCEKTDKNFLKPIYFKKEVLNKYYNEPMKYKVDGFTVSSAFFSLHIDNNIENYVVVFLGDLSSLPHKEQLHWRQYNTSPKEGISITYFKTMIEGSWAEDPETPDLYFKHKYESFNKKWETKFGWRFYKPLAKQDEHYFTALHIPTNNNVKAFCEQILSIVKITIDRLNEAEFAKVIVLEENDKGLTKLEKYLKTNNIEISEMIKFLRNLQDLRSGLIAHSFSTSNKNCKKAMEYFGINENNYVEVAREIFIKSIFTLNTLEKHFGLNN